MKIKIKAILAGFFATFAMLIVQIMVSFLFYSSDYMADVGGEYKYSIFAYLTRGLQFLSYMLGGYVTAWVAKRLEIAHALIVAVLYILIQSGFTYWIIARQEKGEFEIYNYLMGFIAALIGFALGAYIRKRVSDKQLSDSNDPLEDKIENLGKNDPS
ncbi:MAG TPA: hypothetical protein VNB90_10985 [Cytophagaceae bacterium]|nr:hypothetical protein [Cytophagaceae bacterium]